MAGLLTAEPDTTAALRFRVAPAAVADPPDASFSLRSSPPGVALAQMSGRLVAAAPRSTRALRSARTTRKLVAPRKGGGGGVGRTFYGLHAVDAHPVRGAGPLRAAELDLALLLRSAEPSSRLRGAAGAV